MRKTLARYLVECLSRDVIDHALRATHQLDGEPIFYIHPARTDGDTLEFRAVGNLLVAKNTPYIGLPFAAAIEAVKAGGRAYRTGWVALGGYQPFVYLQPGSIHGPDLGFAVGGEPGEGHPSAVDGVSLSLFDTSAPEGTGWRMPVLCLSRSTGLVHQGWSPSQDDLLAEDWVVMPAVVRGEEPRAALAEGFQAE